MAGVPGHDLRTRACALSAPSRPTGLAVTHRLGVCSGRDGGRRRRVAAGRSV